MARSDTALVELTGIHKSFGSIDALSDVSLSVFPGEVVAIVGDNGAGKSTLVKVLSGLIQADRGSITVAGRPTSFASPLQAREAGIATVFQDLALVECLDVATNMFLGQLPTRFGLVDRRRIERESRRFLDELKVTVASVRTPIGRLSGGQRQIVAIARALRLGAPVVVLDEPTAALGVRETAQAARLISDLKVQGTSVICVSHDLGLVFDVADRVQVMRLGRNNGTRRIAQTDKEEVVGLITGARQDEGVEVR